VDKSDRIVNSYVIARRTWKWNKKLFFHLTDMTILNTQVKWWQDDPQKVPRGSCSGSDYSFKRRKCESKWRFHGQAKSIFIPTQSFRSETFTALAFQRKTEAVSRVFAEKLTRSVLYFCNKCDVSLCIVSCFEKWRTRVNL
jgi:hypothetical protein